MSTFGRKGTGTTHAVSSGVRLVTTFQRCGCLYFTAELTNGIMANELQLRQRRAPAETQVVESKAPNHGLQVRKVATARRQGLVLGPTVVLAISLGFVGTVITLHIIGKLTGI
jgi:hypothetical protein